MIFLNNSLIYIMIFGILLQLLVEVKSQTIAMKPDLREGHTATLINDKLYILCGYTKIFTAKSPPKESFLYLDVSVPFNTNELKWYNLNDNVIPPHKYASSVKGGANNDTLFLYGGLSLNNIDLETTVYAFNVKTNSWGIPKITGTPPIGVISVNSIIDYNGLMYWFGGRSGITPVNDMFILDTINLSWRKASSINAPIPRLQYGAVLLPNQNIMYMGGFNVDFGILALNEVYLYDTINDAWTTKTTSGSIPSARNSFSSILGLDGQRVIIYGGLQQVGGATGKIINPETSTYVLDINNYNWYIPKVSGKIPSSRAFHKTVLIGKYMVVTFGRNYTQDIENDILLLDISNNNEYIWTTTFEPPSAPSQKITNTQPNTPSLNTPLSNNTGVLVGAIIGSLIGGILLTIGSFLLYNRYRKNKEKNGDDSQGILKIPGGQEIMQNNLRKSSYYNGNRTTRNFNQGCE